MWTWHLQVIGPLKADELFTQEDFNLLEKYTMKTSAEKIKSKVKTMKLEDRQYVSICTTFTVFNGRTDKQKYFLIFILAKYDIYK